ncbi:MAG: 1,4-dihydroxy-2-naphthoate polyprenyltransferase [Ardenticatenaceae bacterium]|nr:1,4-dihydroxy-2-naphthoate polyprenyltransferase [Ardenticatenaceae bacterium]
MTEQLSSSMTRRQAWIFAARPRTLPLALASIGMGSFLAASVGLFSWIVTLLCALTTIFLQILSNLANDYGDSVHGADSLEREGPQRVTQAGLISKQEMRRAMLICALLAMISGILLLYAAFGLRQMVLFLIFIALGGAAVWAAVAYTATGNPYGYAGFGDLFVLIFFGWVGTMGTYFLQAGEFDWLLLLPATSVGLLAVAVLNVNNMRDIESDQKAGKRSLPVRLGLEKARLYHWGLLVGSLLCAVLFTYIRPQSPWQWLFLLSAPLIFLVGRAATTLPPNQLDPLLRRTVLATLAFMVLFGIGIVI